MWRVSLFIVCLGFSVFAAPPLLTSDQLNQVEFKDFRNPTIENERASFSVTSWNILFGLRAKSVAKRLASSLDADIFLLQEVDKFTRRTIKAREEGSAENAAELIAFRTKTNMSYGIEYQELSQQNESVAVTGQMTLSRFPILDSHVLRFGHQPRDWSKSVMQKRNGGRMALYSTVEISGVTVHLFNTHLESSCTDEDRAAQIQDLLNFLNRRIQPHEPVIIAGDLNTFGESNTRVVRNLLAEGFEEPFLKAKRSPKTHIFFRKLDWVFSRNLKILKAQMGPWSVESDHRAIRVEYSLK